MENNNGNKFSEILIVLFVVFFAVGAVIAYYIKTSEQKVSNVQIESTNIDGNNDKEKQVIDDVNKDSEDVNEKNNTPTINEDNKNKENSSELSQVLESLKVSIISLKELDKYFDGYYKLTCEGSEKCEASSSVSVNSNTLEMKIRSEGIHGVLEIGGNDISVYGNNTIYYRTIKGNDDKKYLFLVHVDWGAHLYILNDEGKMIFTYSYNGVEEVDCKLDIKNENTFTLIDDTIYFYKYVKGSFNEADNYKVKMELHMLTINNNEVLVTSMGIIKDGMAVNCFS